MQTTQIEIQDVRTIDDFERAARVRNAWFPHHPMSAKELESHASEILDVPHRRVLFRQSGVDVAYMSVIRAFWSGQEGEFSWNCSYDPDAWNESIAQFAVEWAERSIRELEGTQATVWTNSNREPMIDVLLASGFQSGQRNAVSFALLDEIDFESLNAASPIPSEYELINLKQLAERRPDSWKKLYWEDMNRSMADVPLPSPWEDIPFEKFEREMNSDYFFPEWRFLIVRDDEIACSTFVVPNQLDQTLADTGLTATRREHRRKGLARAIKIAVMQKMKEAGIKEVHTDNELDNPMLQLNYELGFRDRYEMICFTKRV